MSSPQEDRGSGRLVSMPSISKVASNMTAAVGAMSVGVYEGDNPAELIGALLLAVVIVGALSVQIILSGRESRVGLAAVVVSWLGSAIAFALLLTSAR